MNLDDLLENIHKGFTAGKLPTALVLMETTHGESGGVPLPLQHMATVKSIADEHNVPVHVDGARLFNASIALGVNAAEIAKYCDSICFCLSKGLSAPMGSLICGDHAFIERARRFRRMLGGNLRQAGFVAAAGLYALDHLVERLSEDHRRARGLARGLHDIHSTIVDPSQVETNIVRAYLKASGRSAQQWSEDLKCAGVRVNPVSKTELRFVTHRQIEDDDVNKVVGIFSNLWRQ